MLLKTSFKPTFVENSELVYSVDALRKNLSILIKSKDGDRFAEDTFLYKTKVLTDNEVRFLDSTLIEIIPTPTVYRNNNIVDGIEINFDLIKNGDTVHRHFTSPSKSGNVVGFIITSKAINTFKTILNDTIVSNYFDDVYNYIGDSTIKYTSKDRPIDKLRIKKYGWQLR